MIGERGGQSDLEGGNIYRLHVSLYPLKNSVDLLERIWSGEIHLPCVSLYHRPTPDHPAKSPFISSHAGRGDDIMGPAFGLTSIA